MQRIHENKGFSAWQLVLIFLGAVAVCAVFFSLGYVVGYTHRSASAPATSTENVTLGGNIPPTVNSPLQPSSEMSQETVTPETVTPTPVAPSREASPKSSAQTPAGPATHVARPPAGRTAKQSRTKRKSSPQRKTPSKAAAANKQTTHFAVQVMASKTKSDAITLIKLLEARRYHVFLVTPKEAHAKDNLFRVQVGPFATRAEAERTQHRLEREGFKPFIVH